MSNAQMESTTLLSKIQTILQKTGERLFNRHTLSISAACIVLAAFSGPFGTYESFSFGRGLIVWGGLIGAGVVTAFFVCEACTAIFEKFSEWQAQLAFVAFGSVAISIVTDALLTHWLGRPPTVRPSIFWLWMFVMSIITLIKSIRNMFPGFDFFRLGAAIVETQLQPAIPMPVHNRLAQRLNIPHDEQIVRISANGHFVEVYTPLQSHRIRMRFSDAVAELDDTIGLMVHRSHWVHRSALRGWVPNVAKPYVVLETDAQVPVSKTYFEKVEALGLEELNLLQKAS